jgi:polysaccharide export outer membrane protein
MFKLKFFVILLAGFVLFTSCGGSKRITYFNDIDQGKPADTVNYIQPVLIQRGDILQVTISTINRDVATLFNPVTTVNGNPASQGYLVDHEGNIDLPMIGKIYVRGKTTEVINLDIKTALEKTLNNVFVSTRLLNFKVSVLGDVARPGSYIINNERVSILEALSLAGDANISARRNDVLLIREREGRKQYITINLNDSKILSSPNYYLANNDVIYVRPGVNRVISSSTALQLLPAVATAVTLILVLINNISR